MKVTRTDLHRCYSPISFTVIRNCSYSAEDAAKIVRAVMDSDDKLIVVDATNNSAYWYNLSDEVSNQILTEWNK
ncbi:hypothetical protein [Escherichia coli]|uniref:hypothetical protein n=1 Tax=Escherichia coli TaxID=562 RepID=UPI0028681898|nr:hypothetical protein [Escherichia coli]